MSKRSSGVHPLSTKKPKFDDTNAWDDELDGDLINDCFERASQIYDEAEKNVSHNNDVTLLPSYSIFKQPNVLFTSTQLSQQPTNIDGWKTKVKELQERCAEKEGEVTILRTNLQNLRTSCQVEQEKQKSEWNEKLNLTQKENKTIRSELEFKNLEVANLKQQISELSRRVNADANSPQKNKIADNKVSFGSEESGQVIYNAAPKIHINYEKYYPLKHIDFSFIFETGVENSYLGTTKSGIHRSSDLCLQDTDVILKFNKKKNIHFPHQELCYLINLSEHEINSEAVVGVIDKILSVSIELLTNFYRQLKELENNIQLQDIHESDTIYLQRRNHNETNKIGIDAAKIIEFLAELIPICAYLRNCITEYQATNLKNDPNFENKETVHYFNLMLNIVSMIGKTRREQICSEFLSSLIKFLSRALNCDNFRDLDIVHETAKEMLFLRPDCDIIFQLTNFLKLASVNKKFVNILCFGLNDKVRSNNVKGVLYFSRESCRFHMFVVLLENILLKIDDENLLTEISLNILGFVYNIFKPINSWLNQIENKRCECLCKLYKLSIGIVYKNLKTYQEVNSKKNIYQIVFKNSIKVLSLLHFNSVDLTQKYITSYAQFKEIVYTFVQLHDKIGLDDNELKTLEKLNVAEDFPEVTGDRFKKITL